MPDDSRGKGLTISVWEDPFAAGASTPGDADAD